MLELLGRVLARFREDGLIDWAAALTYYAVLAVFPALIAVLAIVGLVGESATDPLVENLAELAPSTGGDLISGSIEEVGRSREAAGIGLVISLGAALWSASAYIGGFSRASNAIYGIADERPFWRRKPLQLAITGAVVLAMALCTLAVVVTGPLTDEVGKLLGLEGTALTLWDLAKWPVIALVVAVIVSALYWTAPAERQRGFRLITPGGILAVVLWLAASGLFALYVTGFSSYNATYGALAGVVIFLVWIWITNVAILLGAVLNAELARQRGPGAG